MFPDLRYHIISLAAVFMALSVGMLIGGLFLNTAPAETQQRLIRRIQEDLARIRTESDRNRRDYERIDEALRVLMPSVVKQRLKGRRVAVVQTGDDDRALSDTIKALRNAGAEVVSVTVVTSQWFELSEGEKQQLVSQLRTAKPNLPNDFSAAVKALANGVALFGYTQAIGQLSRAGVVSTSGNYSLPCRYVVVVGGSSAENSTRAMEIDRPLIQQWQALGINVVAVERRDCVTSHVSVHRETDIASVDCIETALGQMILPFLFESDSEAYGMKETADKVLPDNLWETI